MKASVLRYSFDPKFEISQPSDYLCIVIQNVLCFENILHIIRKTSLKIPLINVASVLNCGSPWQAKDKACLNTNYLFCMR